MSKILATVGFILMVSGTLAMLGTVKDFHYYPCYEGRYKASCEYYRITHKSEVLSIDNWMLPFDL